MVGRKLRFGLLYIELVEHTLRSSAERMTVLRQARQREDRDAAYQR
ncbi:MAG: hypothetical protein NNA18_09470 [Nitrospira sp.]|nr:hypothetical protein [Nitrospira sp.]